jgi:predicted metal-dependent hydrolase
MAKKELVTDGSLVLGGRFVKYQVFYRAKKNIILRVKDSDLLAVSLPPRTRLSSREKIEGFLRENEAQILSLFEKFLKNYKEGDGDASKTRQNPLKSVFVFGNEYGVVLAKIDENKREKAVFDEGPGTVQVYTKTPEDRERVVFLIRKALLPIIKNACEELNHRCFYDFNEKKGLRSKVPLAVVSIKNMSSRWGSCTASKGRISINFRLVHYPKECLESVFYHEYSHFREQNHSAAFYDVLKKMYPEYDNYDKILKKNKNIYETL